VQLESRSERSVFTLDLPAGERTEPVAVFSRENA
jgi:hypothetical protein